MASLAKIVSTDEFISRISEWKENDLMVVFTNGCFDILHLGHVDYLEKASNFGDKLVIGLNSDRSVGILKGAGRPINDQQARSRVLAALEFVDLVTLFDEDTPYGLIDHAKPDVLVKGGDYRRQDIVGADAVVANGGLIKTIPLVKGYSTSEIISKISS